jgi:hypothetical protein
MAKKEEKSKAPVYTTQVGTIRAAVWQAQTSSGKTYHNVTLSRRYRDGDTWKDSNTFNGIGDCVLALEALTQVREYLVKLEDADMIEQ